MSILNASNKLGHGLDMSEGNLGVSFFAPGGQFEAKFTHEFFYGMDPNLERFFEVVSGYTGAQLIADIPADDGDVPGHLSNIYMIHRPNEFTSIDLVGWSGLFVEPDFSNNTSDWSFNGLVASDIIRGNDFRDTIKADAGGDDVFGRGGNDRLHGEEGNDKLYGGIGDDRVSGGPGRDFLDGGAGADRFTGGGSRDEFFFRSLEDCGVGSRRDVINDFRSGEDRVRLERLDADATSAGDQAFRFIDDDPYSGVAGELRLRAGILAGDVNGDGRSDLQIEFKHDAPLLSDIVL